MSIVKVRKLAEKDLDVRVRWFNCPSISSQMTIQTPLTLEGTRQWFDCIKNNETRYDFAFEWNEDAEDNGLVAMGGLTNLHPIHDRIELYIMVRPNLTGNGIGGNAIKWLCNYAFSNLNLHRVFLYTRQNNDRVRRLYERIGFIPEGILRDHLKLTEKFEDHYVHGMLKKEWQKLTWAELDEIRFEIDLNNKNLELVR